jgi:hypothetical protein
MKMILEPFVETILEKQVRKVNIEQKALVFALLRTRVNDLIYWKA